MVEFDIYFMIRTAFPRAVVVDVYGVGWAKYFFGKLLEVFRGSFLAAPKNSVIGSF